MTKFALTTLFLTIFCNAFCQYNNRPTRSRFYNNKMSTFSIKPGDILRYSVNKDTTSYDIVVTVNTFGNSIGFSYRSGMSDTGSVSIQSSAVNSALIYDTLLTAPSRQFTDTMVFWLSKKNYNDLEVAKETTMDLGNGKETFQRKRVSTFKLNVKGREKIVTVFDVQNTNAKSKRSFLVLNDDSNPLIVKMDAGCTLTLKEVR